MEKRLDGKKVAILVADGFEQVELTEPRKALEAAGWKVGDAADFLGMSDGERQLLETRVHIAIAIRRQREAAHLGLHHDLYQVL